MRGIHINWTKPCLAHQKTYAPQAFELLTTMLSALKWKEKNGKIKLYADKTALSFYDDIKLLSVYDEAEELFVDEDINADMFWAAGKIYALANENAPVAMIDNDFIVWDTVSDIGDCTVIHFEDISPEIYPEKSYFKMKDGYKWNNYDWSLKACNTAFTVINSQELIKLYTDEAIRFMKNAESVTEPLKYMVFSEQRLLNMCAKELGIRVLAFSSLDELRKIGGGRFTHIWGEKQRMRDNEEQRNEFCKKCVSRIDSDFPQYTKIAKSILNAQ